MTKNIKLLVIGCGRIGKMHVDNILTDFPFVEIAAIVDDHVDVSWAQKRGISHYNKQKLTQLLDDQTIDCVLIAASSSEHVELITMAANAGKHIFCEKPISFHQDKLQQALAVVTHNKVKCQVGLNRRFDPDFMRVKQVVAQGGIGDVRIIKITNRDPKRPALEFIPRSGGLFLDFNIHDFDMARFISGANITEVFAMGTVLVDPKIADLGDIDTTIISLKLSNGALCIIDSSRETHYGYDQRVEVFGSKGNICAHNTCPTQVQLTNTEGVHSDKPHYSFVERYAKAYKDQFEHFFDAQMYDKSIAVSIKDIEHALLAARAATQSYQTHKPVQL